MRAFIFLTFLMAMACIPLTAQQSGRPFQRNAKQQQLVDKSIENLVKFGINGDVWNEVANGDVWVISHYMNLDELEQFADNHPSANVRAAAVRCLMERSPRRSKELFYRHVTESEPVKTLSSFCVAMRPLPAGDYLIGIASDRQYLTESEWKRVDSILLASPEATQVGRRNELLMGLNADEANVQRVRQMARRQFDIVAVIYLAQWELQQEQDTTLVCGIIDSVFSPHRQKIHPIMNPHLQVDRQMICLSRKWSHRAFERRLEGARNRLVATNGWLPQSLFRTALNYSPKWFPAFIEQSLALVAANPSGKEEDIARKNLTSTLNALENALDYIAFDYDGIQLGGCRHERHYDAEDDNALQEVKQILYKYRKR